MKNRIMSVALLALSFVVFQAHSAQAASCQFKLIEELPIARVTLKEGATFDWDQKSETIWDQSKVEKIEKLNGNRFKGSFAGLASRHSGGTVALFLTDVVRKSGVIEFADVCSSVTHADGFCNTENLSKTPNYGVFKSLDKVTYRKSVKDPRVSYTIYGLMNPTTGERFMVLAGNNGDYPPMDGGGGTINLTLRPGESSPHQRLLLEPVNDAFWIELDGEDGEAGALGPRGSWLEFTCQN